MKKEISFYLLHTYARDTNSAIKYLQIENLCKDFSFRWDEYNPDYLIVSEQIYSNAQSFKKFLELYPKAKIHIFFTREAQTPDFNIFDYAVGFDAKLSFSDRYVQLPTAFDLYPSFTTTVVNDIRNKDDACNELKRKSKFCNFLYSNSKAHPMRDQLFYKISSYKVVDSLGRHLNNTKMSATGYKGHESECIGIKAPYKFSIASENAKFEGYTSEKIITSLCAHTIPIYFGDPLIEEIINPKCFINVNNYKSLDELLEHIKKIDTDPNLWASMISQPWQNDEQKKTSEFRRTQYIGFYKNIFKKNIEEARRKPEGCRPDIYMNFFSNVKIKSHSKIIIYIYHQLRKFINK